MEQCRNELSLASRLVFSQSRFWDCYSLHGGWPSCHPTNSAEPLAGKGSRLEFRTSLLVMILVRVHVDYLLVRSIVLVPCVSSGLWRCTLLW